MGKPQQDRRDIAVREYIAQGLVKWSEAMRKAGYAESYIRTHGHEVLADVRSKGEIQAEKAKLEEKVRWGWQDAISALDEIIANLRPLAKRSVQANRALIAAIAEKNSVTGLSKQIVQHVEEVVPEGDLAALNELGRELERKIAGA